MKEAKNELMQFVAGIIMLVVGLYIFSQKVIVFSGFFSFICKTPLYYVLFIICY